MQVVVSFGGDPSEDLALEERLMIRAARGEAWLFLHGWDREVLVLGNGQPVEEVAADACRAEGIPVIRRRSGGTAVLRHRDLAVSLVLPADHPWAGSIPGLYLRFLGGLAAAAEELGVTLVRPEPVSAPRVVRTPICFEGQSGETLERAGRKVVGCAQWRRPGAVLVHGLMVMERDVVRQARAFGVVEERIRSAVGELGVAVERRPELAAAVVRRLAAAMGSAVRRSERPAAEGSPDRRDGASRARGER